MSLQQPIPIAPPERGNQPPPLDARTPLLLLPVNIQTRFMDVLGGGPELWVRIYPDQIAINSHETALTAQEIADGQSYWNLVWSAGNPPPEVDAVKAPWRGLAALYGAQRAAWIALQTTPSNLPAQPAGPTPAGTAPNPAPVFPALATRASSWTQPATVAALPDAWTVVLVSGNVTTPYRGSAITPNLAAGLTPGGAALPPGSPVDPGMKWQVDFDAALAAGMALKIPLTQQQRASGFERIFVYGVRARDTAGGDTLATLLNAHHYTDGFSLVPQGAPTNNTPDASSAYSRQDPQYEVSFAVERGASLSQDPAQDGNRFAQLIGIDSANLAHVGYSDGFGGRNGTDMLTALWPSTLGYFLGQMMSSVFTPEQIEIARQYALDYALPRGSVAAFRVGNTPYGVLPITSLRRYKPDQRVSGGSVEPGLVNFIERLWSNWLNSSASAPHMQTTGDPDAQLVALLGMDASSMTFRGRQVFGDDFLWNYLNILGVSLPVANKWWADHLAGGRQLLNNYGYPQWDPRVIHLGMAEKSFPISLPTVQDAPLSETVPLSADADLGSGAKVNYIQWLRQAAIADIQADNYPGPKPTALLYKLLRQSAILEYVRMAGAVEIAAGRLQLSQLREAEIIGATPAAAAPAPGAPPVTPPATLSAWQILSRPAIPNPLLTWAEYLVSLDPQPESPYARLIDMRQSFDRLAALPTAELDRLLTETLDACSHRLDVWATAVANALLQRTRSTQVQGTHFGAFGWVEQVLPGPAPATVQGPDLQQVQALDDLRARKVQSKIALPVPVQPPQDNGGFIFAPSQAQASTAAVLRNGYMTHRGASDEGLLSIDLSSERVRKALLLLDGVRQGQSLNALLGYIFESGLHDLQLDKYAQPFRDLFPIVGSKLTPSSDPSESVAASNVVDGLALRTAWDTGKFPAGGNWGTGLPSPGADQTSVTTLLQVIDDYADALGDLSISEAVFQIIRGNFGRAGGLLNAISQGARPPEPDVVNTPRGGIDLTHRVAVLLAGSPTIAGAWAGITKNARALAEPWLDAWASQVLPDPSTVECAVQFEVAGAVQVKSIRLTDLKIGPLDCLAISDAGDVPQKSELEYRILYAAAIPAGATAIQIDYQPAGLPPNAIFFPDFFYLAKNVRDLVGSSRALTPQDLSLPEKKAEDLGGLANLVELRARATAAVASLARDVAALQTAIAGLPAATAPVRSALLRCSLYGVTDSVPFSSADPDPNLPVQAAAVIKIIQDRSTRASAVPVATAAPADLVALFATIFGNAFVVLPQFTPPDLASLQTAFGQSSALVASDPVAPARWFTQLTQVRQAIARIDAGFSLAQVLGAGAIAPPNLLLGQLPAIPGDKWLALPIDPANPPLKGRVAFACFTQGDPVSQGTYAGLLIDEWPERIPSIKENAAVAFHYEEPKARAPQTLLLAVCPDTRAAWDDDLILGTLEEALELAKIRTVDLDSVAQVGQILPALYVALNLKGATISTNFAIAKEAINVSAFRAAPVGGD
jgi:hypothetical protein